MRLLLVSIALAGFFLLPALSVALDFELPYKQIIGIPATGLDYMAIFFHEIGHTLAFWLFGFPAIPSFDFEYGGGMTYNLKRMPMILYAVYGATALGFFWAMVKRHYGLAAVISIAGGLHLALAFNPGHRILITYMGHFTELLVASFCILRAARGETVGGIVEQYLNMVFGLFVMGRTLILSWGIVGSDIARMAYSMQKGGHTMADLDRLAVILDVQVQSVGMFSLGFTLLCAGVVTALALWLPRTGRLGDL